jgi:hypothetical protein
MPTIDSAPPPPPQPLALLQGAFSGPGQFAQIIRDALAVAAQEGWSEMVWSDPDFESWPLREKAVADSLNGWAQRGRKLVLLASRYDSVQRFQPRFVSWRGMWDHIVECRVCKGVDANEFPSALWSPHWVMQRLDPVRTTGFAGSEPRRRLLLRETLDELRKQSAPGFAASILGL